MKTSVSFEKAALLVLMIPALVLVLGAGRPGPMRGRESSPQDTPPAPRSTAPSPIQDFAAFVIPSGVELVWAVVHERDIEGFTIYRSEDGAHFSLINRDGLLEAYRHTLTDADVAASTTYLYALGVVLDDGAELVSQPVTVKTPEGNRGLRGVSMQIPTDNPGVHMEAVLR